MRKIENPMPGPSHFSLFRSITIEISSFSHAAWEKKKFVGGREKTITTIVSLPPHRGVARENLVPRKARGVARISPFLFPPLSPFSHHLGLLENARETERKKAILKIVAMGRVEDVEGGGRLCAVGRRQLCMQKEAGRRGKMAVEAPLPPLPQLTCPIPNLKGN